VAVTAWCGRCGQQFQLAEVLAPPHAGHCPRCGEPFAPDYTSVVAAAVRSFDVAAQELAAAGTSLREAAPRLHIDSAALAEQLRLALDH
jgi:hypothetical protein